MSLYQHYLDLKRQHPDTVLFFRLGDFYEVLGDDARVVARELRISLTSRPVEPGVRIPMAGLPFHALDTGIARLIARGYPVAVAEQLLDAGRVAEFEPAEGVLSSVPASRGEPEPQQLSLPLQ